MKRKECKSRIVPTAKYITVLDFEVGRVFQYKLENIPAKLDGDGYLTNKGHNVTNCEWMVHENKRIMTNLDVTRELITN